MLKLGAKEQPKAEMVRNTNPIISSDLCLNLTLKAPINKAEITATMEEKVRICPVTPTEVPNVRPISIRRRSITVIGTHTAKLEMTNGGRTNLPAERFSAKDELSPMFSHVSSKLLSSLWKKLQVYFSVLFNACITNLKLLFI
jgi:hypothetical protein